jgi:hypothetical protein
MPTKDYYWRNREKCLASATAYHKEHPDRAQAAGRKFYAKDPQPRLAATREWRAKNPSYHARWRAKNKKKNPVLYMWRNAKNRAKRIGVEFTIKQTDIVVPEFCPVLGLKLEFGHGKGTGFFSPHSPSVDRFDNSRGYVKDNIRVISWRANMLKHDATLDEMRKVLAYMEGHS